MVTVALTFGIALAGCSRPSNPAGSAGVHAGLPRLVDLGAGTCIPCKQMAPILEDLKKKYEGKLDVVFLDVRENPGAATQYGVELIPTQIFFDPSGKELYRHQGFYAKEEILAKWRELGFALAGTNPVSTTRQGATATNTTPADRIVVYCFQGKAPESAGTNVESYAREAVETAFAEPLKARRLQWQVVNYEEPGNEHYAAEFRLAGPCIVVARVRGTERVEWRSLPEVRELSSDKPALISFVQKNVKEFLDYITIPGACCM